MTNVVWPVKGGEKLYRVGGSTGVFGLSMFDENVRLSVQQKCHPSILRSYQMSMPAGLPATAVSADFRHRCIA